jgi:hypothetical protein
MQNLLVFELELAEVEGQWELHRTNLHLLVALRLVVAIHSFE